MEPDRLIQMAALGTLLVLSGFFSAAETALMAIDKIDIRRLYEQKNKKAEVLEYLVSEQNRLLSTILVLNNIANIGASSLATALALDIFGSAGVGVATGIMTLLVLMFGEITPKSIANSKKITIGLLVCKPIRFLMKVLGPIVSVFLYITSGVVKLLGGDPSCQDKMTEDELKTIVEVSHEDGILETDERLMIHNIFEFGELTAKEVMVPRTKMSAINIDISYNELVEKLQHEQYSRYPVYELNSDNIKGVLYIKDLVVKNISSADKFNIHELLRKACVVHEHKKISEVFKELQNRNGSMAIVLDEYGGTAGVITKEDIIEEIFGEIKDEYDSPDILEVGENEVIVDASMRLSDINEALGLELESNDYDSVGGLILENANRIPDKGYNLELKNCLVIVEEVINNKIISVRLKHS